MKNVLKMCLVAALVVVVSGTAQAVTLPNDSGVIWKTWNYEIGTSYTGGVAGEFYFRTDTTSYYTEEFGAGSVAPLADPTMPLSPTNLPGYGSYGGTLTSGALVPDALSDTEDTFGLVRISSMSYGDVTAIDSRFGDGSDLTDLGNDITGGGLFWAEGPIVEDNYLRGILYGSQDQVVECVVPNSEYRIWAGGGLFDIYLIDGDAAYNPSIVGNPTPADRTGLDTFPGWFDETADQLMWSGSLEYFRFQGVANDPTVFDGQTEVLADFSTNKAGLWDGRMMDWWTHPDGSMYDLWQTWNIGDPFVYANGWTGSEDSARMYVEVPIPEPVTMLGVVLGMGSLAGYIRKRKLA